MSMSPLTSPNTSSDTSPDAPVGETTGAATPTTPLEPQVPADSRMPAIPQTPHARPPAAPTPYPPAGESTLYGGRVPANGATPYGSPYPSAQRAPYAPASYAPPATPPPSSPRRTSYVWLYPAGAVAVVILLIAAFAIGHGLGATSTPSTSPIGSSANRPAATVAVPPAAQDLQQTVVNVIHTVQPSVVEVDGSSATGGDIGSGEILTSDGYIVTNDHVVAAADTFTVVLSSGQRYPATVVGTDPQDDLAVLKINTTGLQPIAIADSSKVQVGQFAIAIGSPLGLTQSATFGIVSAVNRTASEAPSGPAGQLTGLIQTSAPINPGNSGGALVDLQGRLIGIPTLGAVSPETGSAADGIGFAIPSDRVKFVADQLIKNGKLVTSGQGFLGIAGQDVTPQLASAYNLPVQSGVLVTGFANDAAGSSPAQSVGIRTGDIIIAVNGQTISDNSDLASALTTQSPGTKVSVTVQRGSSQKTFSVMLGERPANSQG